MKITGHVTVKGRGIVTTIDELPADLHPGMRVAALEPKIDRFWTVSAIEMHAHGREHANGKPAGLLLRGDAPLPNEGDEIFIRKDESYWRALERVAIVKYVRDLKNTSFGGGEKAQILHVLADMIERVEYR